VLLCATALVALVFTVFLARRDRSRTT